MNDYLWAAGSNVIGQIKLTVTFIQSEFGLGKVSPVSPIRPWKIWDPRQNMVAGGITKSTPCQMVQLYKVV